MGLIFQFIGTAIICLLSIASGFTCTWPATTVTLFSTKNTTLNRPMTETELLLLGSLSPLGSVTSTLTAGFMLDKIGKKKSTIIIGLYMIIFWALLASFKQVEVVLLCVFIAGMVNTVYLIAPTYISEICEVSIRGSMTSCMTVCCYIGAVLAFALGGSLTYDGLLFVGGVMSVGSTACIFMLHESPLHLLRVGKDKEAVRAMAFYRQLKVDDIQNIEEINTLKRILNVDIDDSIPEYEKLYSVSEPKQRLTFWKFIKKSKSTRRALMINVVTMILTIFQGQVFVQMYIQPLVIEEAHAMSPVTFSIMMAGVGAVAGSTGAYFTDVAGRRPLIIYGSIASGVSCLILGIQLYFRFVSPYITLILLFTCATTFSFGGGLIPMVLMAELYLPEVKSITSMIVLEVNWISTSVCFFAIGPILTSFGWGPVFLIFALFCFITSIFCYFALPETKGLTVDKIQKLF